MCGNQSLGVCFETVGNEHVCKTKSPEDLSASTKTVLCFL